MAADIIGAGWAYPAGTTPAGGIALVQASTEIEQAMALILGTGYGERPMRPEFGCGIHEYVYAPVDASTAGRLAREVRQSLVRWEPRIDVVDVTVFPIPDEPTGVFIDIRYEIRATSDTRNLVFPFYTIPEERS
jgi:phage baseplate assembly protein W